MLVWLGLRLDQLTLGHHRALCMRRVSSGLGVCSFVSYHHNVKEKHISLFVVVAVYKGHFSLFVVLTH